jgi:hypothetical protein
LKLLERNGKEMIQAKEARINFCGDNVPAGFNTA